MRKGNHKDLTGQRFNRLVVVSRAEDKIYPNQRYSSGYAVYPQWNCICDCGNSVVVRADQLINGRIQSCGCLKKEQMSSVGKSRKKYNRYDLTGEYGIGYTFNSNIAFYFDLEDYELIKNYCWYTDDKNYIVSYSNRKRVSMHRLVTNYKYEKVDHKNHKTWDNRKSNLRGATSSENAQNSKISKANTSGFIGVNWIKKANKWSASITLNKKQLWLGQFTNKEDAIKARLQAEYKYFGEFAPQKHLFEKYGIGEY